MHFSLTFIVLSILAPALAAPMNLGGVGNVSGGNINFASGREPLPISGIQEPLSLDIHSQRAPSEYDIDSISCSTFGRDGRYAHEVVTRGPALSSVTDQRALADYDTADNDIQSISSAVGRDGRYRHERITRVLSSVTEESGESEVPESIVVTEGDKEEDIARESCCAKFGRMICDCLRRSADATEGDFEYRSLDGGDMLDPDFELMH
jgi:hypothetical protein